MFSNIQQIFIELLLHLKHFAKLKGYSDDLGNNIILGAAYDT